MKSYKSVRVCSNNEYVNVTIVMVFIWQPDFFALDVCISLVYIILLPIPLWTYPMLSVCISLWDPSYGILTSEWRNSHQWGLCLTVCFLWAEARARLSSEEVRLSFISSTSSLSIFSFCNNCCPLQDEDREWREESVKACYVDDDDDDEIWGFRE